MKHDSPSETRPSAPDTIANLEGGPRGVVRLLLRTLGVVRGRAWVEEPPSRISRVWLYGVFLLLLGWYGALAVRLYWVQVVRHDALSREGRAFQWGRAWSPAYPGDVVLRDGTIASRSLRCLDVALDPGLMSRESVVRAVRIVSDHPAVDLPAEERRARLERALLSKRSGGRYVRLARKVPLESGEDLRAALRDALPQGDFRGVRLDPSFRRAYPRGEVLASVIGVADEDGRGIEGILGTLNEQIAPRHGTRMVRLDALRREPIYLPESGDVPPVNGFDVHLTLEGRAQRILFEELEEGIRLHEAECGLGIVLDCRNGDVLAMVSLPTYDPSRYHAYPPGERGRRRKNRPAENEYEAGSVMKPFTAAAALQHGVALRDELIWGGGASHVFTHGRRGRRLVTDVHDHGPITTEDAVVYSSNIGLATLGLRLGRERMRAMLESFGFLRPTGIPLPGEASGACLPLRSWRELYTSVSVSFGYAVTVSPLQLAAAFSALVNGGVLYRPRLVSRLVREGEDRVFEPEVVGRPIDEATSRAMREILLRVVQEGTGKRMQMEGFPFGGKSGTADLSASQGQRGYSKKDYLASFIAFAPFEDPEVVVLVMIEKPRGWSIYGSTVSGGVVAGFLRRYFRVEDEPEITRINRRQSRNV